MLPSLFRFVAAVVVALVTTGCIAMADNTESIVPFAMEMAGKGFHSYQVLWHKSALMAVYKGALFAMGTVKLDAMFVIVKDS